MIIFFDKITGDIVGYVSGEKHYKEERNFWIGSREKIKRLLYDKTAPYFNEVKSDPLMARKFKINLQTLNLEPKP